MGEAACRRLTTAIENTCGELTVAAIASRDPKRLRKVIAGMTTQPTPETDVESLNEDNQLLQNTPVAAKGERVLQPPRRA